MSEVKLDLQLLVAKDGNVRGSRKVAATLYDVGRWSYPQIKRWVEREYAEVQDPPTPEEAA